MSVDKQMDKDVVHTDNGILVIKKRNNAFAATWIDLKMIILSEVNQRERWIYDFIYMWNLKKKYKWANLQNRNKLTDLENKVI